MQVSFVKIDTENWFSLKHSALKKTCSSFTDVWMDYVKFEMKRGEPKNISNIYLRAVRQLEPIQADIFIHEFSLVKTCMTAPPSKDS